MGQCIISAGWVIEQRGWRELDPAAQMVQVPLFLPLSCLYLEAKQKYPRKVKISLWSSDRDTVGRGRLTAGESGRQVAPPGHFCKPRSEPCTDLARTCWPACPASVGQSSFQFPGALMGILICEGTLYSVWMDPKEYRLGGLCHQQGILVQPKWEVQHFPDATGASFE